ncbi:hypothetical protein H0H87_000752 [Tephrocybe sp. NHM501043]|nr:hypothetical protein H0H87_000752 [Tephrocybe sp. NHM501043]
MAAKTVTIDDLRAHKSKDSFYILIHGKVYDATKFMDEDATEAFEDVGHSDEARALLPGMLVGSFEGVRDHHLLLFSHLIEGPQDIKLKSGAAAAQAARVSGAVETTSNLMYFFPLAALAAYFAWRVYA